MFAQVCNMTTDEFIWTGGDVHLYSDQMDAVATQLSRTPTESTATVGLNVDVENIFDFTFDDIDVYNYDPQPAIKFPIAAK